MPSNLYASVTAGLGSASLSVPSATFRTRNGFLGRLSLGKEWWVSSDWGLGISLNAEAGTSRDQADPNTGTTPTWTNSALSLAFSATYN